MNTLQSYHVAIGELVPGSLPVGEAEQLTAINGALALHSTYRPRTIVEDISGTGGFDYLVSELASWSGDFSKISQVEYPVDDDDPDPNLLEDEDWILYEKPTGKVLRFLTDRPSATETIRVTYTARHIITEENISTVAEGDEEAVQKLCASLFCDILATYFAQDGDSTIQADSVDHTSKSKQYAKQARDYRKRYDELLGIEPGKPRPASCTQDQDVTYPMGWDRLTHPRRRR